MLEFARWKYILAALVLLVSTVYSLPNLYPQDPAIQIGANREGTIDTALLKRVQGVLEEKKIAVKSIDLDDNLLVRMPGAEQQILAADTLRTALGDDYTVAVNLASTVPDWLTMIGARPMQLGLDLQGGVHFLMQVDRAAAVEKQENAYADDIRMLLRDNDLRYRGVNRITDGVRIEMATEADADKARSLIATDVPQLTIEDGASDTVLRAVLKPAELKTIIGNAIEQNIGTLRKRINEIGVSEPIIQRQGDDRIIVQLPGVQDTALAKKIIGATATLAWYAVAEGNAQDAATSGRVPPDARLYYERSTNRPVLLSKRMITSGDQLVDARSGIDPQGGTPMVTIKLNNVGGKRMFDFTSENVGKPMGVVYIERTPETKIVDGKEVRTTKITEEVISVATINGVFGKNFQTTGLDSPDEAAQLALLLRAGALAAPLDFVEERIIGPSLGAENIERGWKAVTFSFLFVLAFFVVYYKMFGIITNLALLLNLLLVVAVMSFLGATLTLPGLAGIALTVGMSVDANVLINERIREELRLGVSPLASIAGGYDKAAGTIADANTTALLAGVALAIFGSGPVVGFGITLIVGILTSLYTAVSISRGISTLIYGRRRKLAKLSI